MSQISSDASGLGKWFNVFTSMVNSLYFHLTLGKKKSAWRISSLFLTCRGPKLRSPSFCYHWSSTPMVWTGRQTAVQKDFCPCWAYTKFYFHLADWDRDTTKFCRHCCAHAGCMYIILYAEDVVVYGDMAYAPVNRHTVVSFLSPSNCEECEILLGTQTRRGCTAPK